MAKSRRPVGTRNIPPDLILIVTEGEKTEPLYFQSFPLHPMKVVRIKGTGTNTLSLVTETEKEMEEAKKWYFEEHGIRLKDRDICVWCVFDKDDFPDDRFDNAITRAKARDFHVAYSNEAFELWYLLHFSYISSALSRSQYGELLTHHLGKPYAKNDPCMYQVLRQYLAIAIRNAKALISCYNPHVPHKDNPCTTVFELVEYLNHFIRGS